MQTYTKEGPLVFNGRDLNGSAISVDNGESATWSAEIQNNIALLFASNAGTLNGAIVKSSLSSLNGDLDHDADTMAWVVGDSTQGNDGVYQKQGATGAGSWTRLADLPYSVIQINNADAGTANAIQATSAVNIPSASYGALLVLNITAENTGAVTLSVNSGTAKPLVTNTNAALTSGYLVSGMAVLCVDDGTSYRLFSYGDASAVQAAAEAAQAAAEAAQTAAETAQAAAEAASSTSLPSRLGSDATVSTDANTAVENGWYYLDNTAANIPTASYYLMHVSARLSTLVTQIAHEYSADTEADTKTWQRDSNSGTWSSWYRVYNSGPDIGTAVSAQAGIISDTNIATPATVADGIPATKLKYLQAGTSAVEQLISARLKNEVFVTDFGAVGDDSTDCYSAFVAANNYLNSIGGGVIRVPKGIFRISAYVELSSKVSCQGEGQGSEIKLTTATAAGFYPRGNQFIRDLYFTTSVTKTGAAGAIHIYAAGQIMISGCVFVDQIRSIEIIDNCSLIWIKDNVIYKQASASSRGISITGPTAVGNDFFIRDNFIRSLSQSTQGEAGIYLDRSGGTYMSGNSVLWCGVPFMVRAASGTELTWTFSTNDTFDSSTGAGIDIEVASGGTIKGMFLDSPWAATNGQQGLKTSGAGTLTGVQINNPRMMNNSFDGISIGAGQHITINGGSCSGNSGASSGTYHGVSIGAGVSDFTIMGMDNGDGFGFGASQGYGIVVQSGASNNYIVTANRNVGNVTGTVLDLGSGTNKVVANNL